eukprot:8226282-Heterocapsa_arctica.AAC.1
MYVRMYVCSCIPCRLFAGPGTPRPAQLVGPPSVRTGDRTGLTLPSAATSVRTNPLRLCRGAHQANK